MSWAVLESWSSNSLVLYVPDRECAQSLEGCHRSSFGVRGGGGQTSATMRDSPGKRWEGGVGEFLIWRLILTVLCQKTVSKESAAVDAREKGCTTMIMWKVS